MYFYFCLFCVCVRIHACVCARVRAESQKDMGSPGEAELQADELSHMNAGN